MIRTLIIATALLTTIVAFPAMAQESCTLYERTADVREDLYRAFKDVFIFGILDAQSSQSEQREEELFSLLSKHAETLKELRVEEDRYYRLCNTI